MKGNVKFPIGPFRRLVEEEMELLQDADVRNHTEEIAFRAKLPIRTIHRLLDDRTKSIEFDTADALITNLFGPMKWYTDDELNELYESASLADLDWVDPLTDKIRAEQDEILEAAYKKHGAVNPAAREVGVTTHTLSKRLGLEARLPKTFRNPICLRGHDKRVTGVYSGGACAVCRREIGREARRTERGSVKRYKLKERS